MKKKQCQRIKKASKLLVSALMLGVIGCLSTTSANSKELWEAIADETSYVYAIPTNPYVVTQDLGVLKNNKLFFIIYGNGNVIDGNSKNGIRKEGYYPLYVYDVTMSNFYSDIGAAIYNNGTIGKIDNSSFINNSEHWYGGGAIYNDGTIKEIVNSSFMNNSSYDQGGAIYNNGTIEKIVNSSFINNNSDYGGAIFNNNTIEIIDSSFMGNNAKMGGAIYNNNSNIKGSINIIAENKDVFFENNTATRDGGAIYNNNGTITLKAAEGKTIEFKSGSDGIYNHGDGKLYIGDDNYKGNVILNGIFGEGDTTINSNAITNGDIQQRDIYISPGRTLTISNGATISVYNRILNYGTINIQNGTINARLGGGINILKDGIASIANGKWLGSLNFKENATLNLQNNNFDTVTIAQFGAGETGNLSFDIGNDNNDKIDISDWANGTLNLRNININVDDDKLGNPIHLLIGGGNISALKINDYVKSAPEPNYFYRLTQDPTNKGDLVLKRTAQPWTLKQVINAQTKITDTSEIIVKNNYSAEDPVKIEENLGELTKYPETTSRTLTINGNGYEIDGNGHSGIIIADSNNSLNLVDVKMKNFESDSNGSVVDNNGNLYISDSTFTNNKGYDGGAIYNRSGSTISDITGTTFSNNEAEHYNGGAIYNLGTISNITNSIFENNIARTFSGAIYNYNGGTIGNITGTTFSNNVSKYFDGGAIYNLGTISNITDSTFSNNVTKYLDGEAFDGGAISNRGTISNITNSIFENNIADQSGGAIYNGETINNIINVTFRNNSTRRGNGGAITNGYGSTIGNITGSFISNSSYAGGAIYNSGIMNVVASRDLLFDGNYVTSENAHGGAIYNYGYADRTLGLYAQAGKSITFVGGEDVIDTEHPENSKYDIDGIYNISTLNINGNGTDTYEGTVNIYSLIDSDTKGTTNIYGGEVNVAKVIRQNELNIYGGVLKVDADKLKIANTIQNEGSILLGEGILTSAIAGDDGLIAINKDVNVTSNADLLGNDILNAGTLTLTEGTLAKGILGGNTVIDGAINSTALIASAIDINSGKSLTINASNVLGAVANAGTLNLGAGTLSQSITGTGATVIDGTVTANAITQGALTVNTDKTLTASADNLNISDSLTNKGTLVTYGDLNHLTKLNNTNGTVKIAENKTLNVTGTKNLGGTLDLNGQTLNMQNTGSSVDYSTLTVGTLKGTSNLLIDAALTQQKADNIVYSAVENAVVNLTNVNVKEGFASHDETPTINNMLTVLTGNDAEFKINGSTDGSTSTQFGNYLYTFEKGTDEGKLKVTEASNVATLTDYITGTEKGLKIDTYSFANNETLSSAIETGTAKNTYAIGMNGYNLTGDGTNDGITVSSEKTLTVDGNGGTITNFATALINKGALTLNNVEVISNATALINEGKLTLNDVKVISNSKTSDDDVFGGAIKNSGMITTITGATVGENEAAFYNNSATTNADSTEKDVMGGAIYNIGQITKITSDFKENKAIATKKAYAYGGAIYNTQENSVIKEIEGKFTSNEANATDSGARGGAIANFDEAIIGNTDGTGGITGSFNSNKAVSVDGSADGGAIFNYKGATITNINANFNQNTSESTNKNAYGGAIHNESSGDAIAKITNINGKFSENSATSTLSGAYGGAISNYIGVIGNTDGTGGITGVDDGTGKLIAFDGNYAEAKGAGEADGGAIFNYNGSIITNITGDFINNYTKAQNGQAYGGAIHNESSGTAIAKITNINGKFSGNRATSTSSDAFGGAISNYNGVIGNTDGTGGITGVVDDITGKLVAFSGNYTKTQSTGNSEADGGAIFNYNGSIITNITGDFINNYTEAQSGKAYGGAIHNSSSKIYNIEGDFENNRTSTSGDAYAGAISNLKGEIGNFGTTNTGGIKGNFKSNYATSNGGNAQGGAIFSYNTGAKINNIEGNFENNFVKAKGESSGYAYGGAIYNDTATIGDIENNIGGITGKFSGNYAEAKSGEVRGGAIANRNSAKINSITGVNQGTTETPDIVAFYNNHAEAKGAGDAKGGAVFNGGTINSITGKFDSNNAISVTGTASGGAIRNEATISNITGDFIDNYAVSASGIAQGGAIYNSSAISIVAKNGNEIRFQGNYVKGKDEESSLGGAIYNAAAGTIGLYALTKNDKITFAGDSEADKFDIDGIYNLGNLNINGFEKSGETTRYLGEVTLNNVNGTGTTNIYGGTVNVKENAVFNQDTLNNQGIFNFNGTTGQITTLSDAETAKGTTNIKVGSFTINGALTQKAVSVSNGATLSLGGNVTTTSGILNAGTLNLTGGDTSVSPVTFATLNSSIDKYNETVGATNIIGAIKVATGKTIVSNVAVDSTGILELNASLIGADKAHITANTGNIILDGGTLATALPDGYFETKADGNAVTIANTYITDKFTNNGTLILDGNIDRNINGSGTTVLKKDTAVSGNYTIEGTLDGNGKTLDMQNSPAAYNTLSVGGFKGTTNLKIDVDMATTESGKATNTDLIKLTGTSQKTEEENAVLNLKSINVTNLATVPEGGEPYTDYVTYLMTDGGTFNNLTLKLNGSETGEITTHAQSGDEGRDYTFTKGSDGSLTVLVKDASLTIEDFITGVTNTSSTEYSLNSDYQETADVIGETKLGDGRQGAEALTLYINNQSTLSGNEKTNDGITVANGITLNVSGQSNEKQGRMSGFNTALIVDEGEGNVLNVQDMILTDNYRDIENNATLNLSGTNTIDKIINNGTSNLSGTNTIDKIINNGTSNLTGTNTIDKIIGTGTTEIIGGRTTVNNTLTQDNLINNGELTIGASALNIENGVTNNDTLVLNGGTLTTDINGGNLNIIDETNKVVNNATIKVSDIDIFASPTTSAELENNSTIIANNIDNAGVLTANNNSYIKANINGGTFNSNGNNTVVGSIQDNGDSNPATLNLKAGKLDVLGGINVANTVAKGGGLSYINDFNTPASLGALDLQQNMDLYLAADLVQGKMNQIKADSVSGTGKINMMLNMPSRIDTVITNPNITLNPIADGSVETLKGAIKHNSQTVTTPIFNYHTNYDPSTGLMSVATASGGSGSYEDFNSAVFAGAVAAQMGGYLNLLNSYEDAFANMDMTMLMTRAERTAMKMRNKYAAADEANLGTFNPNQFPEENAGVWFKPYASFEKVNLNNGPKVGNNSYGALIGADSRIFELKHGWDAIFTGYAGYNGSHQHYEGNSIWQNGGQLGATAVFYKGDFFTGLTATAGASVGDATTMYGREDFTMLMAGVASKTGYNWELFNGRFIIQPSMLMSYSFINTFNHHNAAGVDITSDPLNAIQLAPGLKFIGNLPHGWQPYIGLQMVWNIMDKSKFYANNVSLPETSVDPYIQYGIGVQKRLGEKFTGFLQAMFRNGGRNGISLSAGFRWALGKNGEKMSATKGVQKSTERKISLSVK